MSRPKHVLSKAEGTQSTPSSEKYKIIFLCALGVLAGETFLKSFLKNFER
jgi:hypothetical protein